MGVSGEPDEIVSIGLIDFEPNEPPLPLRHKFENSLRYRSKHAIERSIMRLAARISALTDRRRRLDIDDDRVADATLTQINACAASLR